MKFNANFLRKSLQMSEKFCIFALAFEETPLALV